MLNAFFQFIFNQFRKNETHLHELTYLFWECTLRCNLHCLHCGSDCKTDGSAKDLSFEDFLKAILPLKKKYNSDTITVSLDGMEAAHNWLRADNQSFERAVRALNLITATKRLNSDVVTCVNKKNIDELEKLKDFLITQQVKKWRLFTITPIGRAAENKDLNLNPQQLKQLMDFIVMARNDSRIKINFCCEAYLGKYELKARDTFFFCRAGIQIASVLIDGSISACPNINRSFIQGNIYDDDFLDVWTNRFEIMRNRKWSKTGICKNCNAFKNCNGGAMHLWDEKKDSIMTCIYQQLNCKKKHCFLAK
jgi:radical SAM protein with 4Fe4S-binding SPASM domain